MADREKGKNMRISVAMATYNGARFITEQLDSIRLQSLPVDQVILRDDGSSDQTLEIVREYLETYELAPAWRITQNGKRLGYAENFRAAVEETDGDYVFFCDQDDIWEPDRVEDGKTERDTGAGIGIRTVYSGSRCSFCQPERIEKLPGGRKHGACCMESGPYFHRQ